MKCVCSCKQSEINRRRHSLKGQTGSGNGPITSLLLVIMGKMPHCECFLTGKQAVQPILFIRLHHCHLLLHISYSAFVFDLDQVLVPTLLPVPLSVEMSFKMNHSKYLNPRTSWLNLGASQVYCCPLIESRRNNTRLRTTNTSRTFNETCTYYQKKSY